MRSMFLAHGSPMNALADNEYTRFLNRLGGKTAPAAVVVASAHWESDDLTVTRTDRVYETVYDFYGFPDELYRIRYPARGSSDLSDEIALCLHSAGFACRADEERGMDHGSWTLLLHLFPQADVPVVQMSLNASLEAGEQIRLGQALSLLGDRNVLFVGSGVTVHNLRRLDWSKGFDAPADSWAVEFDDWLLGHSGPGAVGQLENYLNAAPHARAAAPTPEHFVPWLLARGAGSAGTPTLLHRGYEMGNLSYLAVEF